MQAAAKQSPVALERTAMTMKGIGFTNVRYFVTSKYGSPAYEKVVANLKPEDRELLSQVLPSSWHDVTLFARLLRTVDSTLGRGDLSVLRDVGAFECEQDFNRVLRLFLRVLAPSSIFRAKQHLWRHFQDSGSWECEPSDHGMRATLSGWAADEALCEELSGYLVRAVQFTGGKAVRVVHEECRGKGHKRCVYLYRWG